MLRRPTRPAQVANPKVGLAPPSPLYPEAKPRADVAFASDVDPRPKKQRVAHRASYVRPPMPPPRTTTPSRPRAKPRSNTTPPPPPPKKQRKEPEGVLLKMAKKPSTLEAVHGDEKCRRYGSLVCKECSSYGSYQPPKNLKNTNYPVFTHQFRQSRK